MFQKVVSTGLPIRCALLLLVALLIPVSAAAIVEPETKTEYPDTLNLTADETPYTLTATGVALREKTFLSIDVYVIVSYVLAGQTFTGDAGVALMHADVPKRLQMDLTRGFSAEKLKNAFKDGVDDNFDDQSAFAADMDRFLAYFQRDAQEGDEIIFDYHPAVGLTTHLNGEVKGVIKNVAFVEALWSVWFGKEPADDDMKEDLLRKL